ncbi:Scr1 family TA system antitoxin-like transcriptional regulator [Streptomyces axinellae]|uniref:DUF5753 domain-containing protein n=1 Tax=Streptomyces axinellae TaxID=552788 RepID=A0ABP6C5K7_9ACTN
MISAQYERFLGFEAAASSAREYQLDIVPGLLQIEADAQAVNGVGFASLGPDQIEALTEVRGLRRRHCLHETESPLECHYSSHKPHSTSSWEASAPPHLCFTSGEWRAFKAGMSAWDFDDL